MQSKCVYIYNLLVRASMIENNTIIHFSFMVSIYPLLLLNFLNFLKKYQQEFTTKEACIYTFSYSITNSSKSNDKIITLQNKFFNKK